MKIFYPKTVWLIVVLLVVSCDEDDHAANESRIAAANGSSSSVVNTKNSNFSGRIAEDETQSLYDGSEGGPIDLTLAKAWVQNFKNSATSDEIQSHYFGRDIIDQLLAQEGCYGIRIYYALDDDGKKILILSGVDSDGENMLPVSPTVVEGEYVLVDMSVPCPFVCPKINF